MELPGNVLTAADDVCIARLACGSTGVGAKLGSRAESPGVIKFDVCPAATDEDAEES